MTGSIYILLSNKVTGSPFVNATLRGRGFGVFS